MVFTFWDLIWSVVIFMVLGCVFPLIGVCMGGIFVLRAKGGAYEPLLPKLREDDNRTAYNDDGMEETIDPHKIIEDVFAERAAEDPNRPLTPEERAHRSFTSQFEEDA